MQRDKARKLYIINTFNTILENNRKARRTAKNLRSTTIIRKRQDLAEIKEVII